MKFMKSKPFKGKIHAPKDMTNFSLTRYLAWAGNEIQVCVFEANMDRCRAIQAQIHPYIEEHKRRNL